MSASRAPQGANGPGVAPVGGSGSPEAAADDTALRERLTKVLHSKVTSPHPLADGLARRAADLVMPVVQAALAERERQIREQIATGIEAERTGPVWDENDYSGDGQRWDMAMEHAARIARGEDQ